MIAMILAAGKGTRLQHLTHDVPKALVELDDRPLIDYIIQRLINAGFKELVVNVHHFPDLLIHHLQNVLDPGVKLHISDERDKLLDTGGAIRAALPYFNGHEAVLVHNVDILSDVNIKALWHRHKIDEAMITMAVRNRETSRYLLFDTNGQLTGWHHRKKKEYLWVDKEQATYDAMAFSGIHIVNPKIFSTLKPAGRFSLIPFYLETAARHKVRAFQHQDGFWKDLGRVEDLLEMESWFGGPEGREWKEKYLNGWSPS